MTRETFLTVVAAVGLSLTLSGILWAITWPHFRGRVLRALEEEEAKFRDRVFAAIECDEARFQDWNRRYWKSSIEEWTMGADVAKETHEKVADLIVEFRRFSESFNARVEQFGAFGKAIVHLEATMRELNLTMRGMREDAHAIKTDVAVLKERRNIVRGGE